MNFRAHWTSLTPFESKKTRICLSLVVGGMIRFPVQKSVSSVLAAIPMLLFFSFSFLCGSDVWNVWYRGVLGHPIGQKFVVFGFPPFSLRCLSARTPHDVRVCSQLHFRLRIRDFMKRQSHHGSGAWLIVDSSIPGWLHIGTRGHWW